MTSFCAKGKFKRQQNLRCTGQGSAVESQSPLNLPLAKKALLYLLNDHWWAMSPRLGIADIEVWMPMKIFVPLQRLLKTHKFLLIASSSVTSYNLSLITMSYGSPQVAHIHTINLYSKLSSIISHSANMWSVTDLHPLDPAWYPPLALLLSLFLIQIASTL